MTSTSFPTAAVPLRDAIAATFAAAGSHPQEARLIAEGLVESNLFGHDSHGVGLVPIYLDNLAQGLANVNQTIAVTADHGALVGVDGRRGFGQAIGAQAMALALERARQAGVCVIGVANAHHLARIGRWAEQCANEGFASVHFVNVLATPLVAPWGGLDARLATNPFCVGVPHHPHPLVLDYATSMIAFGKVQVAHAAGKPLADGLIIDGEGRPATDPAAMMGEMAGALLPFGQHKGFALAVMCELLGGALSGGLVQDRRHDPSPMINNMLSIVFDPDKLTTRDTFTQQVDRLARWLRGSPRDPARTGIHLPGEPERATERERLRDGIPLPRATRDALVAAGRKVGSDAFARLFAAAAGA